MPLSQMPKSLLLLGGLAIAGALACIPYPPALAHHGDHNSEKQGWFCKFNAETSKFDLYHMSNLKQPIARGWLNSSMCIAAPKGSFVCLWNEKTKKYDLFHQSDFKLPIAQGWSDSKMCLSAVTG